MKFDCRICYVYRNMLCGFIFVFEGIEKTRC